MGVRSATRDDLREVARIHKARFCTPDYTLGQYSVSLISKFYALFLGRCTFLVHVSQRGVDGFVLGGERGELQGVEHEFMRNHLARCCLETLLRPRLWPAAYATVRRLFPSQTKDPAPQPAPEAPRLLSIAVDKAAEGSGAAAELVKAFEESMSGSHTAYELSVVKTNRQAVRFYEKLGLTNVPSTSPKYFTFRREFKPPCARGPQGP
jgi:ribosomal protein S18 acetylase RimI-like enzyme